MKKILISLLTFWSISASAQTKIIIGDMNGDGVLSIEDITLLTSTILGEQDVKYHICVNEQHEYVDLGLPSGTLWASCNVGANSPEEYGDYFAWGEVEPKANYDWATYFDSVNGSSRNFKKYYNNGGKTELDLEDDAAYINWGEGWRMPSAAQQEELLDTNNCTWTWTNINGKNGYLVKSKHNENSIFLPAAGFRSDSSLYGADSSCYSWSRSLHGIATYSFRAYILHFDSRNVDLQYDFRPCGFSVRPVRESTDIPAPSIPVTSITLASSYLTLEAGSTHTLLAVIAPQDATDKSYTWTSSNSNVATVSNDGVVTAINEGIATITATANDGSGVNAKCVVAVDNPYEYVDLGLPSGTLWATMNVGAERPEDDGYYFAWGETAPKSIYDWSTYFDSVDGSDRNFKKYHNGDIELKLEDDAAYMNWGEGWRMPSLEQIEELHNTRYVTTEWTTQNGKNGCLITSKSNGASLFLPAAGYFNDGSLNKAGSNGAYWSRSFFTGPNSGNYSDRVCTLHFYSSNVNWYLGIRCAGNSVRPVRVSTDAPSSSVPVTSITFDSSSLTLEVGDTHTLSAVVAPQEATDKSLTWTSSDNDVATVSNDGVVTAVNAGTTTITATANDDSGVKAECEVTVEELELEPIAYIVNGVTFVMIPVEHGTFEMGSNASDANSNEKPAHIVTISNDYYIGETEVTQALWKAVTGYSPTSGGSKWNSNYGYGDNYPAYYISWNDCQEFITKLNQLTGQKFRLPTEAEWEFAACGGNKSRGYTYCGSNTIGDAGWYANNSDDKTHPVATKVPNELGIYDMSGNLLEWCSDKYGSYTSSAVTNPTGPSSGSYRIYRGGSWYDDAESCRVAYRNSYTPDGRRSDIGLRLVF